MRKYLPLAAAALLLAACSEKPGYEITGTVTNPALDNNYVYLYEYGSDAPFDSALVAGGKFSFKGNVEDSKVAIVRFSTDIIPEQRGVETPFATALTLEEGKIALTLDTISSAVGTPTNDAEKALAESLKPFYGEMEKLDQELRAESDPAKALEIEKKYDETDARATKVVYDYILSHLNQKMSAKHLFDNRYSLSEQQQNEILSKADSTFKAQPYINGMIQHLEVLGKVAVGKKFTDFEMADPDGKMHRLSEFVGTGKVVLLDFWASWCPPCRREMPHLVELYKQYKAKGFDIVGISLDSKADAWAKGRKDLGITWTQLSDLQGWKNSGAALYGVNSIPHTLLISGDGTIIAKNIHGEEIDAKLVEALK